ncbi:hypothetical protein LUZ60_011442 [Juncus effusus]|nr:hypothetical protein LUZ60_011442 [Juncus effusus]
MASSFSSSLLTSPTINSLFSKPSTHLPYRLTCLPHRAVSLHSLSRRLFFLPTTASAIWDALTGGNDAVMSVRRGMKLFREGDVSGSLAEFDRAIDYCAGIISDYWQRGLSLYYLNKFEEGAEQFRLDVAANPNDTEESIWCFLCEAQIYGVENARKQFLEVGKDSRPVMREAYLLFKDGGDPKMFVSKFSRGREDELFYASLYAGLYYESQKEMESAKFHMVEACNSLYGSRSDDYMAALTKVHCLCRNWSLSRVRKSYL